MALPNLGLPSAADFKKVNDVYGRAFARLYATMGLGKDGEVNTFAADMKDALTALLGDGTAANYGVVSARMQQDLSDTIAEGVIDGRYDTFFSRHYQPFMQKMDSLITDCLPATRDFSSAGSSVLDLYIARMNASQSGVPATPSAAGTLAATTGGAIATCTSGNGPRVVHTLIGENDSLESQPSAEATQVALSGKNNAYTYTIAGTVPAGVTKVGVYRGYVAGGAGVYYWVKDVEVDALASYPVISLTEADLQLRTDFTPPSWMSCDQLPELALLFAAARSYPLQVGQPLTIPTLLSGGMMSVTNVLANPSDEFLGLVNQPSTSEFGSWASTTTTLGALQTENDEDLFLQGFFGSRGVQARVTSALNAAGTVQIDYTYYSASNPTATASATTVAQTFSATTVGTELDLAVPAGRIVRAITAITVGGGLTTGTFIVEPKKSRTL